MNVIFQRPKFDPYFPNYNASKHPNFSWTKPNALIPNNQGGGFQGNSSSSAYRKPPLQEACNAPRGPPPPQPHVAQSYPLPDYNKLDKMNKEVNDIERMIRELKESNEGMMKTMSE